MADEALERVWGRLLDYLFLGNSPEGVVRGAEEAREAKEAKEVFLARVLCRKEVLPTLLEAARRALQDSQGVKENGTVTSSVALEEGDGSLRRARGRAPLTPREREVLALAACGYSNKLIAASLGLSQQTVKNHIYSAMQKLEAYNRAHAVALALQRGLISPPTAVPTPVP